MLWFMQKVLRQMPGAWTFVMVADRTELDVQLDREFADAGAVPREARVHASSIALYVNCSRATTARPSR